MKAFHLHFLPPVLALLLADACRGCRLSIGASYVDALPQPGATRRDLAGRPGPGQLPFRRQAVQDGRQFGQGIGLGKRRTMPVMGAAHSPCFWDGRKDRARWQALGPFEDVAEQFTSVEEVVEHYARVARGSPGPQRTGASWREAR